MRVLQPILNWLEEEDFPEQEFDPYSEEFDEEEAFDNGWKPNEIGFWQGFRRTR